MFDPYFQENDADIKGIFLKKKAISEIIETQNHHSTGVILHIGAQRTSTTMMQAWLWPLVLDAFYLGRAYNYRGGGRFDYLRLPLPVMIRDHFLGRAKIPTNILEKIVSDLFVTSRSLNKKVVLSIEIMEISAIREILQFLRTLRSNREKTGVDFKIICTVREPIHMIRSMFALDTNLKGRFDQSHSFENWFYQFLDPEKSDLVSLSFTPNADIQKLLNMHEKFYANVGKNSYPFFLENARWELWSKILSAECGAGRVHFIPTPGRLKSWKVFSDLLHGEIQLPLKAEIDAYYDELFNKRPHLNALLVTDEMSPERQNFEKFKIILDEGLRRFDQVLDGERGKMLDLYYADTGVFMRSLDGTGTH
jgi:hypothetical protein